ncbi:MAG: chloride channel protein [Gemmatimonadota bacterium]
MARSLIRWLLLTTLLALVTGSAVALFLAALDAVTALRFSVPALLWCLPLGGAAVAAAYARAGRGVERGNNLVIDAIHAADGRVSALLAPLVLVGTLVTHLFGGSAGREGTAVQMGGSFASAIDRHLLTRWRAFTPLSATDRGVFLQAGVAAGFSAVFGTPWAGAIFALEVLRVGRLAHGALVPCLMAAVMADQVTLAWGIRHTPYPAITSGSEWLALPLLLQVVGAAMCFGLASRLFATGTHALSLAFTRSIARPWLRPVLGGVMVIALTQLLGTRDYLGLGLSSPEPGAVTILSSFSDGGADRWSWLLKGVYTAVTIGSGFKGGEVTPLFFIGATLGNTLAVLMQAPVPLLAALGFVAVFAGATNTPIACTIMALELFGVRAAPYFAVACATSFLCSGRVGVYTAQRRRDHDTAAPATSP